MNIVDILTIFVPIAGLLAIGFAVFLARDVLSRDTGTPEMQEVASTIVEGAMAFLRRQYTTIAILAVVTAVLVGILLAVIPQSNAGIDPATHYLVQIVGHTQKSYKDTPNEPIHMHEHMKFVSVFTGCTPVS